MDHLRPRPTYARIDSYEPSRHPEIIQLSNFDTTNRSTDRHTNVLSLEYSSYYHLQSEQAEPIKKSHIKTRFSLDLFAGWRLGALSGVALATVSLFINVVALLWLGTRKTSDSGLVEVYHGNCDVVKSMSVWVHFAINLISTLLLGGSNYCMQCLVAPNRREIDKAHFEGEFLDIGVPSIRNLNKVSRLKLTLWWILGLSSIPLHLMYNSAFYSSIAAIDYDFFIAGPNFLNGGNYTVDQQYSRYTVKAAVVQAQLPTFERLSNSDCLRAYGRVISTERKTVVVVSSDLETKNASLLIGGRYRYGSHVVAGGIYSPFDWMCDSDPDVKDKVIFPAPFDKNGDIPPCDLYLSQIIAKADEWAPYGYKADYCLSQPAEQKCGFNGNIPIIAVVVACNAIKALIMLYVGVKLKDDPIITVGDAIESFLSKPDPTTRGICWITRRDILDYSFYAQHYPDPPFPADVAQTLPDGKTVSTRKLRWFSAAGKSRWSSTIFFFTVALSSVAVLLVFAYFQISEMGNDAIKNMGFGVLQPIAIITGWDIDNIADPARQILAAVLIANLPQVILSFLYLNVNGLMTVMWLADEWSDFAVDRKYLRVSNPKGEQRSTHFLQLPYKVAIPLMAMSGLIHWTISQSIFLAVVSEWDADETLISSVQVASCGFSVQAIIVTMCLTFCLITGAILIGFRRYDGRIPLVGSCSAAISAACHRPEWDTDAALKPVKYGALIDKNGFQGKPEHIGHCCFTSAEVMFVEEGKKYSGLRKEL